MLSRGDPSMFGSVADGQYCVRIIDESLMSLFNQLFTQTSILLSYLVIRAVR